MKKRVNLADYNVAVLIKGCGHRVRSGIRQRGAAIMVGAKGATTLLFKNRKLILPTISEDVAQDFLTAFNQITKLLKLEENDAVVIGSADTLDKAEYGAHQSRNPPTYPFSMSWNGSPVSGLKPQN